MKNVMDFNGYKAAIAYDPEIEMFRGEFVGLNGGADFYASDLAGLRREGSESLRIFRVWASASAASTAATRRASSSATAWAWIM